MYEFNLFFFVAFWVLVCVSSFLKQWLTGEFCCELLVICILCLFKTDLIAKNLNIFSMRRLKKKIKIVPVCVFSFLKHLLSGDCFESYW
jgi:hypothetical protein